jgi:hypothetical protein
MRIIKTTIGILIIIVVAAFSAIALPSEIEYEEVIDLRIENIYQNSL